MAIKDVNVNKLITSNTNTKVKVVRYECLSLILSVDLKIYYILTESYLLAIIKTKSEGRFFPLTPLCNNNWFSKKLYLVRYKSLLENGCRDQFFKKELCQWIHLEDKKEKKEKNVKHWVEQIHRPRFFVSIS